MDHLGVNKMGKNIKKTPLQQPNFANPNRQQPQPQVYNINKNDFRNIVQQLTGSPVREQPPRPPQNHPKPPNHRLQRVRPPPLAPTARPHIPVHPQQHPNPPPYPNSYARPRHPAHFDQISPRVLLPPTPTDVWANTTESPISAYMRYLQNSIIDSSGPLQNQHHPQMPFQPGQNLAQPHLQPNHPSPRFNGPPPNLPSPRFSGPPPNLPSPRFNGPPPNLPSPLFNGPPPNLPSPRFNGPPSNLPSPRFNGAPPLLASPHMNGPPPLLPSPSSQFVLPSPSGFFGLLSPRSPYPWYPPPISPNFSFSSVGQSGILGPGPHPPPSPGYGFPLSPSGFFPVSSPRWRHQ